MKKVIFNLKHLLALIVLSLFSVSNINAQTGEGLGLPGDNLNLSAVLDVFQQSKTLEDFEASLNSQTTKINNLDLNSDGQTDYIKVNDFPDGKLHSIVLQIDMSKNEAQDVAVIYTEKKNNGDVDIQIVGDESLYGKNYVIDAGDNQNGGTPNPGYSGGYDDAYDNGNNNSYNNSYDNYSAPSSWGIVTYMYSPYYSPWYSPFYWGYYPSVWNPWRPLYWNDYYYHCYHSYRWHSHHYYYTNRNRFHGRHAGWYERNRHRSNIYNNNRQNGVYSKTYQGRPPVSRPAIGRTVSQSISRSEKQTASPGNRLNNGNRVNGRENIQQNTKPVVPVDRSRLQQNDRQPDQRQVQPGRRIESNTPQQIERVQPRNEEIIRPQQQPRLQETNRPQQQPRQKVEFSQPERAPERRQPVSTPEPRQQIIRQEPRPVPAPSPRPAMQPSQSRPDMQRGGRR